MLDSSPGSVANSRLTAEQGDVMPGYVTNIETKAQEKESFREVLFTA